MGMIDPQDATSIIEAQRTALRFGELVKEMNILIRRGDGVPSRECYYKQDSSDGLPRFFYHGWEFSRTYCTEAWKESDEYGD